MSLAEVTAFEFSRKAIEEAYQFMQEVGERKFESVALFAGTVDGNIARITTAIIPQQSTMKTQYGLMYKVEGTELHRINKFLYQSKLLQIAQIHTHPTEAYHSETDDEYAIVSAIGGLSMVVPNFGKSLINHHQWAYYRLSRTGTWVELTEIEIKTLIKIV